MRLIRVMAALGALTAVAAAAAQADVGPPWGPETPNFNVEAILRPAAGGPEGGFGLVRFRQPNDAAKIVELGVWLRGLAPSSDYRLQRATDTNLDGVCTGVNWLTLGQGTDPTTTTITTDDGGTARADLFRDLMAIPLGTEFDIHFRVIDAASAVVLESGCYQFVVDQ